MEGLQVRLYASRQLETAGLLGRWLEMVLLHSQLLIVPRRGPEPRPSSPFSEELHPFVCKYEQRGKHLLFGDLVGPVVKGCRFDG